MNVFFKMIKSLLKLTRELQVRFSGALKSTLKNVLVLSEEKVKDLLFYFVNSLPLSPIMVEIKILLLN